MIGTQNQLPNEVQFKCVLKHDQIHEIRVLKTTKLHTLVDDSWVSKNEQKDYSGEFSCPRIAGLALLGDNQEVIMKVDMLHPNVPIEDFTIPNGSRYTQWESATLKNGAQLVGMRGNICELGWLDLLSFNVSETKEVVEGQHNQPT